MAGQLLGTGAVRVLLEEYVTVLREASHIIVESAVVLPGRSETSLPERERFPAWAVRLYEEVGGAHISWRLSPAGCELLHPGQTGGGNRYASGNLDILTPEDAVSGLGMGWDRWYDGVDYLPAGGYMPIDFPDSYSSVGVTADADVSVFHSAYYGRCFPLPLTMADYLRQGARLLFLDDWQFSLLAGEDGAEDAARCRERIATVTGIPV